MGNADPTRSAVYPSKSGCRCVNHLGKQKAQHKTKEAATDALMRMHLRHGAHFVRKCPTSDRWHVVSQKDNRNPIPELEG